VFLIIFPNYAMGQALIDLYNNYETLSICETAQVICPFIKNQCCFYYNQSDPNRCGNSSCLLWTENYLQWEKPGLLRFFVFMPLQFLVVFSIVLFYEAGFFRKISYIFGNLVKKNKKGLTEEQLRLEQMYDDLPKDSDVIEEENRISLMNNNKINNDNSEIFIVDKLTKHYSDFMAVKGISFAIGGSECFGLLGVNGAGKTSTFKMITGDELITQGEAYLNQISIKKDIKKVFFYNCINYFLKL
jgi:ATP-binding cassette subfamily A (ABC1) protein 3